MVMTRIIAWACLLASAIYWLMASNEAEMFIGSTLTILTTAIAVRINPQPVNNILRWLGLK